MGSAASVVVAEIIMQNIEEQALSKIGGGLAKIPGIAGRIHGNPVDGN